MFLRRRQDDRCVEESFRHPACEGPAPAARHFKLEPRIPAPQFQGNRRDQLPHPQTCYPKAQFAFEDPRLAAYHRAELFGHLQDVAGMVQGALAQGSLICTP